VSNLRGPSHAVGQEIGAWWEYWDDDNNLHCGSGTAVVLASSRSSKVLPVYEAMRILEVSEVRVETWNRVTKVDVQNGDAEEGSMYGAGASGSGWIKVALPVEHS
jgi:hypothetical protein